MWNSVAGLWNSNTKLEIVDQYQAGHSALAVEENVEHGNIPGVTVSDIMSLTV
jgi:hypothetical protein